MKTDTPIDSWAMDLDYLKKDLCITLTYNGSQNMFESLNSELIEFTKNLGYSGLYDLIIKGCTGYSEQMAK